MKDYVVVVGGLNIDIAGLSGDVYREKDSNIGEVTINIGGVGQNIAQNLTKLGTPTYLVTVYVMTVLVRSLRWNAKKIKSV